MKLTTPREIGMKRSGGKRIGALLATACVLGLAAARMVGPLGLLLAHVPEGPVSLRDGGHPYDLHLIARIGNRGKTPGNGN